MYLGSLVELARRTSCSRPAAPVHRGAALGRPRARRGRRARAAAHHPHRRRPRPERQALRLPVPSALPGRAGSLPRRAPAARFPEAVAGRLVACHFPRNLETAAAARRAGVPVTVDWSAFARPTPPWFSDAKLGIFVHWGAYSVPAWAEPTGELGAVDGQTGSATTRTPSGTSTRSASTAARPAPTSRRPTAGPPTTTSSTPGRPRIRRRRLVRCSPAPARATSSRPPSTTTASRCGTRRAPARATPSPGPAARPGRRVAEATRGTACASASTTRAVSTGASRTCRPSTPRPSRRAAARRGLRAYAYGHVRDLIDRYRPDVLWNDIEWPDAGKHDGRSASRSCSATSTRPCPTAS